MNVRCSNEKDDFCIKWKLTGLKHWNTKRCYVRKQSNKNNSSLRHFEIIFFYPWVNWIFLNEFSFQLSELNVLEYVFFLSTLLHQISLFFHFHLECSSCDILTDRHRLSKTLLSIKSTLWLKSNIFYQNQDI